MTLHAVGVLLVHDAVRFAVAVDALSDGFVLIDVTLGAGQVMVLFVRLRQGGGNAVVT